MLVVHVHLGEKKAKALVEEVMKPLAKTQNLKLESWGLKDLAYKIQRSQQAYYYLLHFTCADGALVNKFRHLVNLKKAIIRCLIINLTKEYGYRAMVNPKKSQKAVFRAQKFERIKEMMSNESKKETKEKDHTAVKITDI